MSVSHRPLYYVEIGFRHSAFTIKLMSYHRILRHLPLSLMLFHDKPMLAGWLGVRLIVNAGGAFCGTYVA